MLVYFGYPQVQEDDAKRYPPAARGRVRSDWTKLPLEQLPNLVGQPGSMDGQAVELEMQRRQTAAQISAARYMLWSVVAIAITSGLNALFAVRYFHISAF